MSELNIFQELADSGTVRNCVVVGQVTRAVSAEDYLANLDLRRGFYVEVETFAVIDSSGEMHPLRGTVIAASQTADVIGKTVEVRKTNKAGKHVGLSLRAGSRFNRFETVNVLDFVRTNRDGVSGWYIWPNTFIEVDTKSGIYADILSEFAQVAPERTFRGLPEGKVHEISRDVLPLPRAAQAGFHALSTPSAAPGTTPGRSSLTGPATPRTAGTPGVGGTPPGTLVRRSTVTAAFPGLAAISEAVNTAKEARRNFYNEIISTSFTSHIWMRNSFLDGYRAAVANNLNERNGNITNRDHLLTLVEGEKEAKISTFILSVDEDPHHLTGQATGFGILDNLDSLFFTVTGALAHVGLVSKVDRVFDDHATALRVFMENPYKFAVLLNLDVVKADYLFFMIAPIADTSWWRIDEFEKYRDFLIVLNILQDENIPSSMTPKSQALRGKFLPGSQASRLVATGLPFSVNDEPLIKKTQRYAYEVARHATDGSTLVPSSGAICGLRDIFASGDLVMSGPENGPLGTTIPNYRTLGWLRGNDSFSPSHRDGLLDSMDALGLCVITDTEAIASNYLEMEYSIYVKSHFLASFDTDVTDEMIAQGIADYEASKGFKLEELQKDGVALVKHRAAVLSGQAGSGKTTVSEAFIKILSQAYPNHKVMLAAPTGKAARRMKEVVGHLGEVKTIHSMFKLGIGAPVMFARPKVIPPSQEQCIYILDEMAMATTSLIYNVLTAIEPNSMVYFLGDIKQLPPIGKGTPFRDMLNYMPAIELGVSKRAAEGSGINKNCDIINQHSEPDTWENFQEANDFRLIPSNDANIVNTILAGVANNAKRLSADDIQVATPYATPTRPHSSTNLNPKLQDIFLPDAEPLFTHSKRLFRTGARTIHVKSNKYGKPHYLFDAESSTLRQVKSCGVVNGELGHVVGIVNAAKVTFQYDDAYNKQLEDEGIDIELDGEFEGDKARSFFVLVSIDDADLGGQSIVVYRSNGRVGEETDFDGQPLRGGELNSLELSYALTVHKLQGSQAKMVVIPVSSTDKASFVNRNMLYTAISRAQESVVLVGSVTGDNSALNNSRKVTEINEAKSMMSVLSGLKEL